MFREKCCFRLSGSVVVYTDVSEGVMVFLTSTFYCGEARAFTHGLKIQGENKQPQKKKFYEVMLLVKG